MISKSLLVLAVGSACLMGGCASEATMNAAPEAAIDPGSAERGAAYARQVCAECHAVEAGQGWSPNPNAPAFAVIANTPGMSARALSAWLYSPHPTMPSLVVDSQNRRDIAAYLRSLERSAVEG
jgi:mono/diheme cytochrome c family protein